MEDVDAPVKAKPKPRKPKTVIPIGRNGLKKRKVTKTRRTMGADGYTRQFFLSSQQRVDEIEVGADDYSQARKIIPIGNLWTATLSPRRLLRPSKLRVRQKPRQYLSRKKAIRKMPLKKRRRQRHQRRSPHPKRRNRSQRPKLQAPLKRNLSSRNSISSGLRKHDPCTCRVFGGAWVIGCGIECFLQMTGCSMEYNIDNG